VAEASRLAEAAAAADVRLRLLGGVAIAIRCPSAARPPLARRYGDIDVATRGGDRRKLGRFLAAEGYRSLDQLNAVHGKNRLFYYDTQRSRRLDVFLDQFEMCHQLDLRKRIDLPGLTLPLADLLLTKLQVVQTTEKDLGDIAAVLLDHELTTDEEGVNVAYLGALAGADWGLWKTVTLVTERARRFAGEESGLAPAAVRAEQLLEALDRAPKSAKWTLRARVGERVRWYKLPEEPDFD
jgi:hypothetical protein